LGDRLNNEKPDRGKLEESWVIRALHRAVPGLFVPKKGLRRFARSVRLQWDEQKEIGLHELFRSSRGGRPSKVSNEQILEAIAKIREQFLKEIAENREPCSRSQLVEKLKEDPGPVGAWAKGKRNTVTRRIRELRKEHPKFFEGWLSKGRSKKAKNQ